jgi:hypothetical protein
MRKVYGVSDKVLTMTLSCILLAAPRGYETWREVGATMIAIDTLVHNFLHRTGILARFCADHPYGSACYRPGGCADIITLVAGQIDAREFNPTFLAVFPRFVQHVTAPSSASMSATATASMIGNLATMSIVRFAVFVTASP